MMLPDKHKLLKPGRVLILQTAFLGDVILTIPLVKRLKSLYPEAEVDFLTIPSARNLLETLPYIDQLLIYDKHDKDRGVFNLRRWQKKLQERSYDLAIIPHRSLRSALLAWGAKIPVRIGFNRSAGRLLFNSVVPYLWGNGIHEINRNLHLLSPLGVNSREKILPEFYFTADDKRMVDEWLSGQNLNAVTSLVTMAPGSIWATKRWMPERYAELADKLMHNGYGVILIGGAADGSIARQILDCTRGRILDATGIFSLRQSALLIKKSRLLITNDSAPLHMGVAVRTPILAIFGPTVPAFGFYPYGQHDRVIEEKELSCRPCSIHGGNKCPIGTFVCMKNIHVPRVFEEIRALLNETVSDRS